MNCIYCQHSFLTDYVFYCADCNCTYRLDSDLDIYAVCLNVLLSDNNSYTILLDSDDNETIIFKNGFRVMQFPYLVWLFPANAKDFINKIKKLEAFS